jgi:p-aminobenzoyl-glutamate transporter AbgT
LPKKEKSASEKRSSILSRFLTAVERIGTVIATMLPYSVAFLVGWTVLLVVWMLLGLPLGPGAELYLTP